MSRSHHKKHSADSTRAVKSVKMELYLDLRSQPCRSVFMFAKLNEIPFDFKLIDLAKGRHAHRRTCRLGAKSPTMQRTVLLCVCACKGSSMAKSLGRSARSGKFRS